MDTDGYPDDGELRRIAEWQQMDFRGLMRFVRSLWRNADWGWKQDGETYSISTGGWSGNEDIISALKENQIFWASYWEQSRRGGHYVFSSFHPRPLRGI